MTQRNCNCEEGFTYRTIGRDDKGHRIYADDPTPTELHVHDCEYIATINRKLPARRRGVNGVKQ